MALTNLTRKSTDTLELPTFTYRKRYINIKSTVSKNVHKAYNFLGPKQKKASPTQCNNSICPYIHTAYY